MLSNFDKAIAGGAVSWIANALLLHFHITLPADVQTGLAALIVSLIVWATPNVEKILQPPQAPVAPKP